MQTEILTHKLDFLLGIQSLSALRVYQEMLQVYVLVLTRSQSQAFILMIVQ